MSQSGSPAYVLCCKIKEVQGDLLLKLKEEEELWKLKARATWLTTRDLNTRFFHLSTVIRQSRNAIEFLKTDSGAWLSSRLEIDNHIVDFFRSQYQCSNPVIPPDLEGLISPSIFYSENDLHCAIPEDDDIFAVVKLLGSHKTPGPDGLTALFFKSFWPTVGAQVIVMVRNFFCSGFFFH